MPHEAFTLEAIRGLTNLEDRVSCMTYNGDNIYVGTSSGRVAAFLVTQRYSGTGKLEYEASKLCEVSVGKGAVVQVEVIPDLKLLLALCDGGLGLYACDTLKKCSSGPLDSKNILCFAVNLKGPPRHKICLVSSRRRLRLYEWTSTSHSYVWVKDLDVPDVPRALVYVGLKLWVGYSREYNAIYEDTGEVKDVLDAAYFKSSSKRDARPLLKFIPGDEMLLLLGEEEAVQVPLSGEPPTAPWLQFKSRPLALGYCYPYLISVSDGASRLEVHAARAGRDELVHSMSIPPGVVGIADGRVGSISRTSVEAGKGRNPIYIAFASPGTVMRLQPVPVERQIEDMMRQFQVHAAQELLLNTAPEPGLLHLKLNRLNLDAARVLLLGLHFEHAFQHMIASPMDVREVLALFPDVHLCTTAVAQALGAATRDASATPLARSATSPAVLARAYCTPCKYFTPALLRDVARGVSKPSDGASSAVDAYIPDDAAAGASLDATHLDPSVSGDAQAFVGVCTGVVSEGERLAALTAAFASGAPDISAIIAAGLEDYRSRLLTDDKRVAITSPAALRDGTAAARLAVAHEGLLKFLRVRRVAVMAALRGDSPSVACTITSDAVTHVDAAASMTSVAAASASSSAPAPAAVTLYNVAGGEPLDTGTTASVNSLAVAIPSLKSVAKAAATIPPVTSYTCSNARLVDLQALALAIDTAIMKILLKSRRFGALDRMLCRPNSLDTCDAVATLRAYGRFHSVALLLRARGMAREALTVWRDLGTGVCSETRPEVEADSHVRARGASDDERPRIDSLSDDDALDADADDDAGGMEAEGESPSESISSKYDGVRESIAYLRRENNMNLVEEFGEWLLRLDPRSALAIFTRPHPSRITHAMPDAVITYLSSDKFAGTSRDALRLYLEHLLYDSGRNEDRFHTLLLHTYLDVVTQLRGDVDTLPPAAPASTSSPVPSTAITVLEMERMLGGTRADRARPGYEGGRLGDVRADLIRLLQESGEMDAQRLLSELRASTLYEERVLLHARLGQHSHALSLLVRELADHAAAVRYCLLMSTKRNAGIMADDSTPSRTAPDARATSATEIQPFLILLQLYITADRAYRTHAATIAGKAKAVSGVTSPPRTTSIFLDRALDVITQHAEYMHPREVAALLPDDLPLSASGAYWNAVLPAAAHAAREAALVRNLYNFELISVHASLIERQARAGEITRSTTCIVCDKRIGDSVFALLPAREEVGPTPVHFHCLKEVPTTYTTASSGSGEDYGARVLGLSLNTRSGSSPAADASVLPLYDIPARRDGRSYALARVRAREVSASDMGVTPSAILQEDGPPLLDDAGVRVPRALPLLDVRAHVRGGVLLESRGKYVLRNATSTAGNRASTSAAVGAARAAAAARASMAVDAGAARRGEPSTTAAVNNLASAIVETHYGGSR